MKIQKIQLQNFKRFTDLTIDNIPTEAKLVLLIGSNGSGKSSIFDAFDIITVDVKGTHVYHEENYKNYYLKDDNNPFQILIETNHGNIEKDKYHSPNINKELATRFFGRSSIRIIPKITNQADTQAIDRDLDSPRTYIENDTRFINDVFAYINEIDKALREPVFSGKSADTLKIFQDFIKPLNTSLINIFDGDEKTTIQISEFQNATPTEPAKLIFKKGTSKISYELLSHGEKQVVILLLNFIVRKKYYEDAIIFIDEMDCHLNTSLQYNLLKEITEVWIPDNSQLWTASHALGFIDYARDFQQGVIIDFDLLDFDLQQTLIPQPKENLEVYEIAIPKNLLFNLLSSKKLVVCENKNDEYYNLLDLENTIFVGVKDSRDVFLHAKNDSRYHSIRDRDFLSDTEILKIREKFPNHHILKYYNFENYLYHPDNIEEVSLVGFDKQLYIEEITSQKEEKIHYILSALVASRQTYEEFKTEPSFKDKEINQIIDDFKSTDFERFYKYFDMKKQFNKSSIDKLNLNKEKLVSTNWFKSRIKEVLEN